MHRLMMDTRRRLAVIEGADLTQAVKNWSAAKDRPVYPAPRDPPGQTPKPVNPPQKDNGPQPVPLRPGKKGEIADAVARSIALFNRRNGF